MYYFYEYYSFTYNFSHSNLKFLTVNICTKNFCIDKSDWTYPFLILILHLHFDQIIFMHIEVLHKDEFNCE